MSTVPNYVHKYMELSMLIGQGYMFQRLVNELRAHPVLVNKIILNKPIPEDQAPDPVVVMSILERIEEEYNNDKLEPTVCHCFQCGTVTKFQNEDRHLSPGSPNGYFLCDKCNF